MKNKKKKIKSRYSKKKKYESSKKKLPSKRKKIIKTHPAKDAPQAGRDEEGSPGVQAVVEQLPQGPGGAGTPSLFAVYAVCRGGIFTTL